MASQRPDFFLGDLTDIFSLEELDCSTETELYESLFDDFVDDGTVSTAIAPAEARKEMNNAFESGNDRPVFTLQPRPALEMYPYQPATTPTPRFKKVTEDHLKILEESRQSNSTKKNTKWGIKLFQDWSTEVLGSETNFQEVTEEERDKLLVRFYAEATPKQNEKRERKLGTENAAEYHKNTMKNIRSAINRHLKNLNRNIDVVRDKSFRKSNNVLDGKLKYNLQKGLSRPTKHHESIPQNDLLKINTYLFSECNPVILRYRVWYILSMNFVSRGLEFHEQLTTGSFVFSKDENNVEYVTLSHETKEKNWQGGLDDPENSADKRMYASPSNEQCPVASLRLLLRKTDPRSSSVFNHCSKNALAHPEFEDIWYTDNPVKHHQYTRFMDDISKHSKCDKHYTAHCLRTTAIQGMNDAGINTRHIMYMSGHRSEKSVRSYSRECSTSQKKSISGTLSSLSSGNVESNALVPSTTRPNSHALVKSTTWPNSVVSKPPSSTSSTSATSTHTLNQTENTLSQVNSNTGNSFMTSGLISNSTFSNC
ncbi:hypothetical protein ScPMuIL_004145, partial [Solemya velum]